MYLLLLLLIVPCTIADDVTDFQGHLIKLGSVIDYSLGRDDMAYSFANLSRDDVYNVFMRSATNNDQFIDAINTLHNYATAKRAMIEKEKERGGNNACR